MNHSHYPAFGENLNVTFLELYRRLAQTTSSSKRYHPTIASSVGSTVPLNTFLEETADREPFALRGNRNSQSSSLLFQRTDTAQAKYPQL